MRAGSCRSSGHPRHSPKMRNIGNFLPGSSPHEHCEPKSNCHDESIHPQTLVCSHPVFIQTESGPIIKTIQKGLTSFDAWRGHGVRAARGEGTLACQPADYTKEGAEACASGKMRSITDI